MLSQQFGENFDAAKYRGLYISKVYEQNKKTTAMKIHDELLGQKLHKIKIRCDGPAGEKRPPDAHQISVAMGGDKIEQPDHADESDYYELALDKIGLLGFVCNEITLTKFLTIEEHLSKKTYKTKSGDDSNASEHPLQRLIK